MERKNLFPQRLSKRVVGGHVLYSPVVTVVAGKLIFVSGLLARARQAWRQLCHWSAAEHRGGVDEARARRRQFSVTRSALAGGMKHECVDRALVLLAATVQMLGRLT